MALIIFGNNQHMGKSYEVENFCCPYCEHYDATELFLISEYFHIFYIPYLPTDKSGSSLCTHCKKVVTQVNFSPAMTAIFKTSRKSYRHPLKIYTGFLLFPGSVILAWLIYILYESSKNL